VGQRTQPLLCVICVTRDCPALSAFAAQVRVQIFKCLNFVTRKRVTGWEEGGDDARSAWPSDALGYTRGTMARTMGRKAARWS
jgi:hypothetical protein